MTRRRNADKTITETLRRAINESGLSFPAIEKATGVARPSLMRFASGEGSIRLDMADKLAKFFGIEVMQGKGALTHGGTDGDSGEKGGADKKTKSGREKGRHDA